MIYIPESDPIGFLVDRQDRIEKELAARTQEIGRLWRLMNQEKKRVVQLSLSLKK